MAEEIRFVDQTLRDGNQSLWALTMSTPMMLPVASRLNEAGFSAIDLTAPAHFKSIVRDVHEDPWERIRLVAKQITRAPLCIMQQCSITGFGIVPKCLAKLWMETLHRNGIRRIHLMEASNDFGLRVPDYVRFATEAGMEVALAATYSISPKHTDEYYAQKTRDMVALKVPAIFLKDPGGLLTPERVKTLVPVMLKNAGATPLEFHSHCTTGLAPLCYLEAVKQGIRTLHTAIPPLANSSSQPSVLNVAENLRHLGYAPRLDFAAVAAVAEHLSYVAKREGRVVGAPVEYDEYQYVHQIPGGVISNLKRQLAQLKLIDRLPQVIEECIRVRVDFGYPIMVTPFSQYIATQAAINVVLGERYKQVTDDLIYYALGFWGKGAAAAIDGNVLDKIKRLPRARELADWEPPEPTIDEVRNQYGGPSLSDEELLLRYIIGNDDDIRAMRAAGPINPDKYVGAAAPLRTLIEELLKRKDLASVSIRSAGLDIAMER
jgi:oxaloacetate decarboxylase alpha subunit